jgi:Tfp pilus assembly protein PilF
MKMYLRPTCAINVVTLERLVLKNAPYLKEAYIGLAKIYFKRSEIKLAKKMLENALKWSYKKEEQQLYKMKLSILSAA